MIPAVVVVGLFWLLREIEQWLHRHIFKVGWLVTKSYQTTTVLYYTMFLPGVVLHEFVYWLAAGVLNVRAERAIQWPEKQEIGELNLNFIRLSKKASPLQIALISAVPPVVGLLVVYWIATNVFDIRTVFVTMQGGELNSIGNGLNLLLSTPDFWLWTYLVFTISNTMMPGSGALKGWRPIILSIVVIAAILLVAGLLDNIEQAVVEPLMNGLNGLSTLFTLIIAIDLFFLAVLAIIENSVEVVTGDSATFKNGKMIAMTRAEVRALKQAEREKAFKRQQRRDKQPALPAGPPTIYRMALPIPGGPGEEPVTQPGGLIVEPQERPALDRPQRREPSVITGSASPGEPEQRPMPLFNPSRKSLDDETEADTGETVETVPAASATRAQTVPAVTIRSADDDFDDDEDNESEETITRPPVASAPLSPRPALLDDDAEGNEADDIDEPVRPGSPSRPATMPSATSLRIAPADDDDIDNVDDADEASEDSGRERPAASSPARPYSPSADRVRPFPPTGVSSPVKRDSDEKSEGERPSSSPLRPATPARPFSPVPQPASPAGQGTGAALEKNEDDKQSGEGSRTSPAAYQPRPYTPAASGPAANRPAPFIPRPASPVPKPVSKPEPDKVEDEDDDEIVYEDLDDGYGDYEDDDYIDDIPDVD